MICAPGRTTDMSAKDEAMPELPDKHIFMMCPAPRPDRFAAFPAGFSVREMSRSDLPAWMAMPFDDPSEAATHRPFMERYVARVYGADLDRFLERTAVVERDGRIAGVCTGWKTYGKIETVHWLKVKSEWEGLGLGRALMTRILEEAEFPVYLHTQPDSFRAIGLYADLGFKLLEGERFGLRTNHLAEGMAYLEQQMLPQKFRLLETVAAPGAFVQLVDQAEAQRGEPEF